MFVGAMLLLFVGQFKPKNGWSRESIRVDGIEGKSNIIGRRIAFSGFASAEIRLILATLSPYVPLFDLPQ